MIYYLYVASVFMLLKRKYPKVRRNMKAMTDLIARSTKLTP